MKLALFSFDKWLILGQPLQYLTNLNLVLTGILGINEYVVEINKHETVDKISENV